MRIIQFILICMLLGEYSVKTQKTDLPVSKNTQRTVLSGSKVGISMSSFSGEHASGYLISELYGIFVNIPSSEKYSIQSELVMGLIRWEKSRNDKLTIPTLSWPFLLKYYPGKDFNLQFGRVLNFLLMYAHAYDSNFIREVSIPYHRYDSGLCGGLGFDFSRTQIYSRYYEGLVNINPLINVWVELNGESQFLDFTEKIDPFNLVYS